MSSNRNACKSERIAHPTKAAATHPRQRYNFNRIGARSSAVGRTRPMPTAFW